MAHSYNGWIVLAPSSSKLHKWLLPAVCKPRVQKPAESGVHFVMRNGSAGFLLMYAAFFWNRRIERIPGKVWDDWGYANRNVRGSAAVSNHASGTAIDINATRHPMGVRNTLAYAKRVILLRFLKRRLRGCVRWGGTYSNRPDDMHFEIDKPLADCERVARILMRTRRGAQILALNPSQAAVILS